MNRLADGLKAAVRHTALRAIRLGADLPGRALHAFTEHAALRDVIREEGIDVILDVGANTGQFAEAMRRIGFGGRILSFEPARRDFEAASRRMRGDPLWSGLRVALGEADGEGTMNVVPSLTVMNSLLAPARPSRAVETETIAVRRLDGLLPTLLPDFESRRILLKMDTQGYDLRCFAGAAGCIGAITALYSELSVVPLYVGSPHYLDALARYEEAGFALLHLSVVSRRDGAIQEMNGLMRRRAAAPIAAPAAAA